MFGYLSREKGQNASNEIGASHITETNRMAMMAAMKKVLSPSSDTIMTAKDAMKACAKECACE